MTFYTLDLDAIFLSRREPGVMADVRRGDDFLLEEKVVIVAWSL
jgi:hypothetical protein